jgi:predicted amidohydrolase YtcJ
MNLKTHAHFEFSTTNMIRSLKICAVLLLVGGIMSSFVHGGINQVDTTSPDIIYVNGRVITMDSENPRAEAVAIKAGNIIAVGSNREIHDLAKAQTRVEDLANSVLLPGFYATHDHFPDAGKVALFNVDLNSPPMGKIRNMHELIEALRARAQKTPKGKWVVGLGYDDTLLQEKRHPTRYDLDKVSTEHPIWIGHTSWHLGVANSMALRLAKITKDTPQPNGGVIQKDPLTGEPNGVLEECGSKVRRRIPSSTIEQRLEAMKWCVKEYASKGVTTTVIAHGSKGGVSRLYRALEDGILKIRVISMTSGGRAKDGYKLKDDMLKLGAVKLLQDGSNQGYTGYFSKPYHTPFKGDASYCGYPRRSRKALVGKVKKLHSAGHQIAIHGNGDAAIDDIIYAFEQAQKEFPREDARHRIEHCQMVREDQLDRMLAAGITPSFFVAHVYYWGDRHRDIFMGPERAANISPLKSSLQRGIRFTTHNDTPVTPVDPLHLVWVSVNRLTRSGKVLGPEQRITPKEALCAVTLDAAWQNFEEDIKGSITVGKLADFVVLAEDPLTIEPTRIKDIKVLETIVGGETIYKL